MITIPITFCMLIAKYLCLLKPFWLRKNNKTSVLLIIIILAMILGVVKIQVWLNDWNNDFFNALSQKETDKLWQLVLWFPALLGIFVLISVNKTWLIKLLTIRWREWLTDYYLNRWFADKNYYFTQIYGEHKNTDNPDQRIAEDILLLISKTLSLSFGFIQSLSMLITFTVIIWQSAGTLDATGAGLALMPMALVFVLVSPLSGTLAGKLGSRFMTGLDRGLARGGGILAFHARGLLWLDVKDVGVDVLDDAPALVLVAQGHEDVSAV